MKSNIIKLLLLLLTLVLALGICACEFSPTDDDGDDDDGDDDGGNDEGEAPDVEGKLTLVSNYKAKFQVVIANGAGTDGRKAANNFVKQLRDLGIDIADAVNDSSAKDVADVEIIVGTGARNRGNDCNISATFLGNEGYTIKTVGTKIVIAGGTAKLTEKTLEDFIKNYLGIDKRTEEDDVRHLYVKDSINLEILTVYDMDYIKIGGTTLDNYKITYNGSDEVVYPTLVNMFHDQIYNLTGYNLPIVDEGTTTSQDKRIFFRYVNDAGEDGFRIYNSGNDFILECSYSNAFVNAYGDWMEETILGETSVDLPTNYTWTKHVSTITYEQFGAVGNGYADDFIAIFDAHQYANEGGQTVIGTSGKTYYIGQSSAGQLIDIRTNVVWTGAKFIIDDSVVAPYNWSSRDLFRIGPSTNKYDLDYTKFENLTLTAGQANIGLTFDNDSLLILKNVNKKMYIRSGGNKNDGQDQQEIILVDKNGNVDTTTPIMWDYDDITSIEVIYINDDELTIDGGEFTTKANVLCNSFPSDGNEWYTGNQYYYYGRGISIERSNTVLKNLTHKITGEGDGGYPYSGWLSVNRANNVIIDGCTVSGHKAYTENRPGGGGTTMGSYDLNASLANDVTWKNMNQLGSITSNYYWGVMASNYCKNLTYDNCRLSRFDAHEGVWNVHIKDSEIGLAINLIGGGTATIENTKRLARDYFIELRADYGSLWRGDVTITNCEHKAYAPASANADCSPTVAYSTVYVFDIGWRSHDFGYTCYLPQNITVENFKTDAENIKMYSYSVSAACVTDTTNPLVVTKSVTYKKQSKPISLNSGYLDGVVTLK